VDDIDPSFLRWGKVFLWWKIPLGESLYWKILLSLPLLYIFAYTMKALYIILLVVGVLVAGVLVCTLVRALRYRHAHPWRDGMALQWRTETKGSYNYEPNFLMILSVATKKRERI
jgi:hypothetical protein